MKELEYKKESFYDTAQKQTVEMRSPDASANIYQLMAGLAVACRLGFDMENALELADKTYVNVNIHKEENAEKLNSLACLPDSCEASAKCLQAQRAIFEKYQVFSPAMLDDIIATLDAFKDANLRAELAGDTDKMLALVEKYFHC